MGERPPRLQRGDRKRRSTLGWSSSPTAPRRRRHGADERPGHGRDATRRTPGIPRRWSTRITAASESRCRQPRASADGSQEPSGAGRNAACRAQGRPRPRRRGLVRRQRESRAVVAERRPRGDVLLRRRARFPQVGIRLKALWPGEPNGMYHSEEAQEDFLVLAGECLLLIEGEERPLRAWDFVHCPAGTEHIFIGAGDGPCLILMVGARGDEVPIRYPVSESLTGTARASSGSIGPGSGLCILVERRDRRHTGERAGVAPTSTLSRLLIRDVGQLATPAGTGAPLRGSALARSTCSRMSWSCATARESRPSARCAISRRSTATSSSWTAVGCARFRVSSTATRTPRSAATASTSSRFGREARATRSCTRQGRHPLDRPRDAGRG